MPVLQHAARHQPCIEFRIRGFRRRLVRHGDDDRLAVLVAVELHAFTWLDVGIVTLAITPQRFLAVHHRPAHATHLVVGIVRRQIVAVAAPEGGIFLEQTLLQIETEIPGFLVLVVRVDFAQRELADIAVLVEHLVKRLAAIGGVGVEYLRRPYLVGGETL
ncbi:hypothetical protein D3C80_1159480 [compost metagenome]